MSNQSLLAAKITAYRVPSGNPVCGSVASFTWFTRASRVSYGSFGLSTLNWTDPLISFFHRLDRGLPHPRSSRRCSGRCFCIFSLLAQHGSRTLCAWCGQRTYRHANGGLGLYRRRNGCPDLPHLSCSVEQFILTLNIKLRTFLL